MSKHPSVRIAWAVLAHAKEHGDNNLAMAARRVIAAFMMANATEKFDLVDWMIVVGRYNAMVES